MVAIKKLIKFKMKTTILNFRYFIVIYLLVVLQTHTASKYFISQME